MSKQHNLHMMQQNRRQVRKKKLPIQRDMEVELQAMAKDYPVVTLVGPRQSGKTTLVQHAFPEKPYVNLESPENRTLATEDPNRFLQGYPEGVILDEIQNIPQLLSYIQVIVDQQPGKKGLFILTGSHQLALHEAISQSLAGRTVLLKLLPPSISELKTKKISLSLDDYLWRGFYPRIHNDGLNPTKAYKGYFQTYIERDVHQLIQVKKLHLFQRFVKLCAGRVGQIVEFSSLANEVGVSSHTIAEWISVLEASYIIFLLQPYFENFGKRIIKSPKLYFSDVGIATYLLGIENTQQLARDPLRGHLVENMVILELMKYRLNRGFDHQLYYYRDSNKNEVDVIFKRGHQLIPIEIKSAQTYNAEFLKGLNYFKKLVKDRCHDSYVIYGGAKETVTQDVVLLNYKNAYKALAK